MQWIKLEDTHSTNGYVTQLLKEGKAEKDLVVLADYQESGRGQGSNQWLSERGESLLMSLLLFPAFLSASRQFYLSMMASLAICDFLDPLGLEPKIKWPNDLLASRGKIAGLLIEHGITGQRIDHTILGIGLNLNQSQFPPFSTPATSLLMERAITLEPDFAGEGLVEFLMARYDRLSAGKTKEMELEYLDRLFGLDQTNTFISEGNSFTGIIRGVNQFGELLVSSEGREKAFGFQEIKLVQQLS